MVTGTVQSLGHQSLVITSRPEKQAITVVVNSETRYAMSNRPASFSNLRAGQTVTIRGQVDPEDPTKILALSILIT